MWVGNLQAQYVGTGSSVFSFLDLPVSARQNALGGNNVSVRDGDISGAFMNPSLLGDMTDKVLQLNFAYYGTAMFGSAMFGYNFKDIPALQREATDRPERPNYFAAGIHYLDYGRMDYANEHGTKQNARFGAKDILIQAMYARPLSYGFTVGATLKPVISVYERYTSFALGADIGAHYQMPDSTLQIGLALRNIGWQLKGFYSEENGQMREMLPINLELGINYRVAHAPLRFGLTIHNLQQWNLGYEMTNQTQEMKNVAWYDMLFRHTIWSLDIVPKSERFYLTVSYNHRRRMELTLKDQRSLAGFALGAGVRIYKFRVGFAFSQLTKSNYTYQVSLSTDINSFLK